MTLPPTNIRSRFLSQPNDLGVVAVGFSGGQCKPGVDAAPTALIASGLLTQLKTDLSYTLHHDNTVHTYSSYMPTSDPPIRGMKNPLAVSAVTEQIASQVYTHAREGRLVLTLGGDHSIAIGTVAGTARAIRERAVGDGEMGLIWVDAHADINTPETSDSGNVHGMPVAWLGGLCEEGRGKGETVFGWLDGIRKEMAKVRARVTNGSSNGASTATPERRGVIDLKKVVYIGLRDVDRGEKDILRREGIKAFSMHDIDRHGIGPIMDRALAHLGTNTPIHLSFDVDALDPQWAPSTGTPVRGGLTLREGDFIAECVHESGNLIAVDLVEVNPSLDAPGAQETIRAGCSIVRCALGDTLL
ncbi:Arginase, catabolizes arginine to ornithine and urea [Agyrium rufum]|nr:Arginase, catabolizes arginine to ornithine and urea [Agyrium rufum]